MQKIGFVLGFLHIPVSALLNRYIVFEGEEGQDAGRAPRGVVYDHLSGDV